MKRPPPVSGERSVAGIRGAKGLSEAQRRSLEMVQARTFPERWQFQAYRGPHVENFGFNDSSLTRQSARRDTGRGNA